MVEHDLAKVGVASSNLVSRSNVELIGKSYSLKVWDSLTLFYLRDNFLDQQNARVVELVDTQDLKSCDP